MLVGASMVAFQINRKRRQSAKAETNLASRAGLCSAEGEVV